MSLIHLSCNSLITGSQTWLNSLLKILSQPKEVLLVTETPPGTPNGFGVTLSTFMSGLNCSVVFTDATFKKKVERKGFVHAHCPYHKSKKYLFLFLLGIIPEWRGKYSKLWLFLFLRGKFDVVYSFFLFARKRSVCLMDSDSKRVQAYRTYRRPFVFVFSFIGIQIHFEIILQTSLHRT